MSYSGTIVSHDPALHRGLVLADGHQQAIGFTEGDVINWTGTTLLLGEKVSFEVVQTPSGPAAIHMILVRQAPRRTFGLRPGDWLACLIGPIMVAVSMYWAHLYLLLPHPLAYALAINFISLIIFAVVASTPRTARTGSRDATLLLMAFGGGAPVIFLMALLIRSRLRTEGFLALLFALVIIQLLFVHKYYPIILDLKLWRLYISFSGIN